MHRKCENCGAYLDAGEICDCKKEDAAPDGSDPEAAQMNFITDNLPNNSEKVKEESKKMGLKSWNEMRKLDITKHVKKRDGADYLPWASCLKLLYENGAEKVISETLTDERGSSLFMSEQIFTDKNGGTNRCYEVRVRVTIDNDVYTFSYPVLNGINAVRDALMNQNAVHKSQMRAFVKCVAINTGLGFDLWLDDADIENDTDDLSKHNLFSIKERLQIAYTKAFKKGMTTKEIAEKVGMTEDEVKVIFTYCDQLHRFEQKLNAL